MKFGNESTFYKDLLLLQDETYQQFSYKLVPTLPPEKFLGIRIPHLRSLAKHLLQEKADQVSEFLNDLPHFYYDENNLHSLLLSEQKDFTETIKLLDCFLPQIDNWATCDVISPKIFKKHKFELLPHIRRWMFSEHEYTIRFGIEMLMTHFMDDDFKPEYLKWVVAIQHETYSHEAYYVKMMIAWFFATALTKQFAQTLPIIEQELLDPWTHNKTIQKARESRQISADQKEYLYSLKRSLRHQDTVRIPSR